MVLPSSVLLAHPALDDQIAAVSAKLGDQPCDGSLLLERARLLGSVGRWEESRRDLDRASRCHGDRTSIEVERAALLNALGHPLVAKESLDALLAEEPEEAEALLLRARVLSSLDQMSAAATDYDRAISLSTAPNPDLYLERAHVQALAGRKDEALRGLDEGLARLGTLGSLERAAIEVEASAGRYEAALHRLERAMSRVPRPEAWLALRGEILERARRREEAREAYVSALAAIEARPARRRATRAQGKLEERVRAALARIDGVESGQAD